MLTYTEMTEQIRQEGIEAGMQKGRQEGVQKGESKAMHNLARNMVTEGLAIEMIV